MVVLVVCCFLRVVHWALVVVCWRVFVSCCFDGRCLLPVVWSMLFGVKRLVFGVRCLGAWRLFCLSLFVVCCCCCVPLQVVY